MALGATPAVVVAGRGSERDLRMYIHSNVDMRMGRLQHFINGPEKHLRQASDPEAYDRNSSTRLAIRDWLFEFRPRRGVAPSA